MRESVDDSLAAAAITAMAIILYGSARSRAMRVLWMLEELGLAFEHRDLEHDDPALKQPEFLALNPAGAIPLLVDDGLALPESMAINLYLARGYGQPAGLAPAGAHAEANAWRWSLFAQGHIEPWVQRDAAMEPLKALARREMRDLARAGVSVLDRVLADRPWLTGERFGVADLNAASVLSPSRSGGVGMEDFPHAANWLQRCFTRPAAVEVRRRHS